MKRTIYSLQDALIFQLQALYFAQKKIQAEFKDSSGHVTSERLKQEMERYAQRSGDQIMKLERIFHYMMMEAEPRKNKVILKLLEETEEMLIYTESAHLRDILFVSCLQNVNGYVISSLKIAYMLTLELGLDTASDLLQQLLESELDTSRAFARIAIDEFNRDVVAV